MGLHGEALFLLRQEKPEDVQENNGGNRQMTKYIFVTGGVVSGLGKGISAASLGRLLKWKPI
mgnify:CR=1 FL=1